MNEIYTLYQKHLFTIWSSIILIMTIALSLYVVLQLKREEQNTSQLATISSFALLVEKELNSIEETLIGRLSLIDQEKNMRNLLQNKRYLSQLSLIKPNDSKMSEFSELFSASQFETDTIDFHTKKEFFPLLETGRILGPVLLYGFPTEFNSDLIIPFFLNLKEFDEDEKIIIGSINLEELVSVLKKNPNLTDENKFEIIFSENKLEGEENYNLYISRLRIYLNLGETSIRTFFEWAINSPGILAILILNFASGIITIFLLRSDAKTKQAEEALAELVNQSEHNTQMASIGALAAKIAHEINQPLAAIEVYSASAKNIINKNGIEFEELKMPIKRISELVTKCSQIIQSVLAMSRKNPSKPEVISLNQLLKSIEPIINLQAKAFSCVPIFDIPSGTEVFADKIAVEQVILNISKNAFEEINENELDDRRFIVRASQSNGNNYLGQSKTYTKIEFINANKYNKNQLDLIRLITPFKSDKPNNLGLGLNICKTLLEKNRGFLDIDTSKNNQTIFQVFIPITSS